MSGPGRMLLACASQPVDRVPVWLMRQAGRYLPEYRKLRQAHAFLELCETPELAVEVTLQPMRRFDLDAAIVFADILLLARALGADLSYEDGVGPQVSGLPDPQGLRFPDADRVREALGFVGATVHQVRAQLPAQKAVIGFAGAPFTLLSYLLEGGPSTDFALTKALMNQDAQTFSRLLDGLAEMTFVYLELQVAAGADVVQLFDSWVGALAASDFRAFVQPVVKELISRVRALGVPVIYFAPQTAGYLREVAATGPDVVSVDWRLSLAEVRRLRLSACQGNLDPAVLRDGPRWRIEQEVRRILGEWGDSPGLIFNLGHGVDRRTPVHHISWLIDAVHAGLR